MHFIPTTSFRTIQLPYCFLCMDCENHNNGLCFHSPLTAIAKTIPSHHPLNSMHFALFTLLIRFMTNTFALGIGKTHDRHKGRT